MRKSIVLMIVTLSIAASSFSQSHSKNSTTYTTALGIKVWDGAGISLKHFFNTKNAGELIGYFYRHGFRLTGLYEIHGPITGASGLQWYIGPGVHLGFYDYGPNDVYGNRYSNTYIGIDGVLGLDYKFKGAPINLSLDWQPAFEFGDGRGFNGSWGGLGIRYTF